ncbi:glycosyltransferase family protein [Neoroseomonas soli]|uniref:Uncharacterized protein n=1 Tax=Neoroseomonas soli TaxID=1081025 RepID=A0A9X9WRY5_9PROT|nr:hypothetical protein [Neoroseomonas soli]MBR0669914.1 hypothetical protein [Neoroseomonas soli]
MTDDPPSPDPAEIAGLVARHAPGARRFLSWQAGASVAHLLQAARRGRPDWVMGIEASEAALESLLPLLPADPCLHLRAHPPLEPPPPDRSHPLQRPARHGLRADVVLLPGPGRLIGARAALGVLAPEGVVLLSHLPAGEDPAILLPAYQVLERGPGLTVLRPRRPPPPPAPRPPGRHAIIVLVVGDQTEAEWEITGPSVTAYAASIGAELHVLRDGRGLPTNSLKSVALDVARDCDRFMLMDADILVRPHCPDLFAMVPPEAVGAYPEGLHFNRSPMIEAAMAMHHVPPLTPRDYFNAGVMVFSRAHLELVAALGRGTVAGLLAEQDTLVALRQRLGIPLHRLTPEFNLIAGGRHLADWRCGWMLHTAGSPKTGYRRRTAWQREALPEGEVWTPAPLPGRALRLPHMQAQAARLAGQEAHVLDPDVMDFAMPRGMPRIMPSGVAAAWIAAGPGRAEPAATGRIERPAPGRWRLCFVPVPGEARPRCGFVARLPGLAAPLLAGVVDTAREVTLDVPPDAAALEIGLTAGAQDAALAGLLLLRPAPGIPATD